MRTNELVKIEWRNGDCFAEINDGQTILTRAHVGNIESMTIFIR